MFIETKSRIVVTQVGGKGYLCLMGTNSFGGNEPYVYFMTIKQHKQHIFIIPSLHGSGILTQRARLSTSESFTELQLSECSTGESSDFIFTHVAVS